MRPSCPTIAAGIALLSGAVALLASGRDPRSLAVGVTAAATRGAQAAGGGDYDLDHPLRTFELPRALRELSAVTSVDERTVACLQDEKGVLFLVDVLDGRVRARHVFGPDGDYEGLARVGTDFYVLRSDGLLARVAPQRGGLAIADTFALATPNADLEGLCHDATRGVLLLAPKDAAQPEKKPDQERDGKKRESQSDGGDRSSKRDRRAQRDQRVLYAWHLERRALLPEPALRISVDALRAQAAKRGDELPTRTTDKGKERTVLELKFSCVAVHPSGEEIYLLSAVEGVLAVVDRQGGLRRLHRLNPQLLPQPEGLTFMPGGDLIVTSEGVDGPARLAVYRR